MAQDEQDISVLADAVRVVLPAAFAWLQDELCTLSCDESAYAGMGEAEIVEDMKARILRAVNEVGKDTLERLGMDAATFLVVIGERRSELDVFSAGKWRDDFQLDALLRPFTKK